MFNRLAGLSATDMTARVIVAIRAMPSQAGWLHVDDVLEAVAAEAMRPHHDVSDP